MHCLHVDNRSPNYIRKHESSGIPGNIDAELPIFARTKNCRRDEDPRLVLRIHIHLGGNHHVILRAGSSHNTSKTKEWHLRKCPKERETFLDEPTFLPTLPGQSRTPIQPRVIAVSNQSLFLGNIFAKIIRITSG